MFYTKFYKIKFSKKIIKELYIFKMVNTIDMQDIRYINLFGKITRIDTRYCFKYNEAIVFSVPKELVAKAIGTGGKKVKKVKEKKKEVKKEVKKEDKK